MLDKVAFAAVACWLACVPMVARAGSSAAPKNLGPHFEDEDFTTCKEFSRFARFNPYSVLDDIWVVFYYYTDSVNHLVYNFYVPSTRRKKLLQKLLNESVTALPVNWTQPLLVMKDIRGNASTLLVQAGDRGQFIGYPVVKKLKPGRLIYPHDIYFKQSDGGKYLTFMLCMDNSAFVMARPYDIPRKAKIQDEVAKVGFRGPEGKSYLYRGHKWMPIPEADDHEYPPERFYLLKT